MPAGSAYPSGHVVPSPILGLANVPIVETKFLELAMSLLDFSPRIPLGTFSILPLKLFIIEFVISTDLLSFEHPSVLLFCFVIQTCNFLILERALT